MASGSLQAVQPAAVRMRTRYQRRSRLASAPPGPSTPIESAASMGPERREDHLEPGVGRGLDLEPLWMTPVGPSIRQVSRGGSAPIASTPGGTWLRRATTRAADGILAALSPERGSMLMRVPLSP